MNLPKIDLSTLPDLDTLTGMFGSMSDFSPAVMDDSVIIIMVFIYELLPPGSGGGMA